MQRATISVALCLLCLVTAAVALLPAGAGGVSSIQSGHLLAVLALATAAIVSLANLLALRANCARLGQRVAAVAAGERLSHVRPEHADLRPLADAVNGVIDAAQSAIDAARLQVKELQIQLKVADAERQHAEAIIYSISDAVLVTDPFDEVVLANESAAHAFQFDLARATRAPIDQILKDPKMVDLIRQMRQSESRSGRRVLEHQVRTAAGQQTFKVTLSCVSDNSSDQSSGVVAVLHDMTRERQVAQMKNDFVSSVSHELRTPLASIKAYVEMLIDGEADDDKTQREFYEVIQNEANRLGRLIDNILNVSRIESGLVQIHKQPLSLMVVVKEAIEVITPQAKLKQIQIVEQLTPACYQTLADKDMLYQAVLNLLSNAVKYTPAGGAITVQATVDEASKKAITRIIDTGVGIQPKDLPFVFDKFYRCESNNHMAKGSGLGLALVKQIVETVHHGRVFVESEIGKGSCFGLELDLCQ